MISFLRGTIFEVGQDTLVIEVGGIGYQVAVHPKDTALLGKGDSVFLYTSFIVREDMVQLFGFIKPDDLLLFKTLISASGIGPKTALAITGATTYRDFAAAVMREDVSFLVRLPGVGKKTAQKMVLELKDKLAQNDSALLVPESAALTNEVSEARAALQGLGFAPGEVEDLLQEALKEKGSDAASNVLVKHVLQRLGGKGAGNGAG